MVDSHVFKHQLASGWDDNVSQWTVREWRTEGSMTNGHVLNYIYDKCHEVDRLTFLLWVGKSIEEVVKQIRQGEERFEKWKSRSKK